jgi:hypothetical protein
MSIDLLCCNFKITTCPVDSHSNYLVKWTFLSFYNVVTVPTSLVVHTSLLIPSCSSSLDLCFRAVKIVTARCKVKLHV